MNMKRVVSFGLAVVFMFSSTYAVPINITDMPKGWSEPAVLEALDREILVTTDGKIRPMEHLTRAEMALGINNIFGASEKADISGYFDVPKDKWYYEEMQKAVKMGTFSGYGNGQLKPEENISRQEMFSVLYNALQMEDGDTSYLNKFSDKNLVSEWAMGRVASMVQNNYVAGNADGRLNPIGNMSREEFAQIMKNIFKCYYNEPGTYTNIPTGNVIINTRGVTLKDSTVNGDLIIADGVGNGEIVLNNVTVMGRTIVRGGGENSIKLLNSSVLKGVVIVNSNVGKVRIYNSKSVVNEVSVKSEVILDGDFENVSINEPVNVEIKGKIENVNVNYKSKVKVTKGTIGNMKVNEGADDSYIYGSGKVINVGVNANDVAVKTAGSKVTAGRNVDGVKAGDKEVKPGNTVAVKEESGGGSSGGGSSSSSGGNKPSSGGNSGNGGNSGAEENKPNSGENTSSENKLPEFSFENGVIAIGENWSKYEVKYSDSIVDFENNDGWKFLSQEDSDWYSGASPIFTIYGGIGEIHASEAFKEGRHFIEPIYFAIRDKENVNLKQIIQVREVAKVEELRNEDGKNTGIKVGDDFENYRYDINYQLDGKYECLKDKVFYNQMLSLPYDARVTVYKVGQEGRLNSSGTIIDYIANKEEISIPDFKVDLIAGGIDLGTNYDKYVYGLANSGHRVSFWYNSTESFISSEKIVSGWPNFVVIAEKDDKDNKQEIDVAGYYDGSIWSKVDFDYENFEIIINDDDYTQYEYCELEGEKSNTIYWNTISRKNEPVGENCKILIRKKATSDKFASDTRQFISFPMFELDVESKSINLGEKWADYKIRYLNNEKWSAWYESDSQILSEGNDKWTDVTEKIEIALSKKEDISRTVLIRYETPEIKIDKLNGKLIFDNFSREKDEYEIIHKGFYEEDSYYDIENEDDLIIDKASFSQTVYIREKGNKERLPSTAMVVERINGIVQSVSDVKIKEDGTKYRDISVQIFDPNGTNNISTKTLSVVYENLEDTYLLFDGTNGKTLSEENFGIKQGDAIIVYDIGQKSDYTQAGFESYGIKINNIVLAQESVPKFSISEGKLDFGEDFGKYKYNSMIDSVGWYNNLGEINKVEVVIDDIVEPEHEYFAIFSQGNVFSDIMKIRDKKDEPDCTSDETNRIVTLKAVELNKYQYRIDDGNWTDFEEGKNSITISDKKEHWIYVRLKCGSLGNGVPGYPYVKWFDEVDAVEDVTSLGIMSCDSEGDFLPKNRVTYGEMAKIVGKMVGKTEGLANEWKNKDSQSFCDVKAGGEYTGWINLLENCDLLIGFEFDEVDGKKQFNPEKNVTADEVLTFMINALGKGGHVSKTGTWPDNYITEATQLNLTKNVKELKNEITREDIAIIIHNTLDKKTFRISSTTLEGEIETLVEGKTLRETYFAN